MDLTARIAALGEPWTALAARLARGAGPRSLRDALFEIRDMPYGRPSSPALAASALSEWRGTCSSKHIVVAQLLRNLGIRADLWMARYRLVPGVPWLPESVRRVLPADGLWDVHNYVTAAIGGERACVIDVT